MVWPGGQAWELWPAMLIPRFRGCRLALRARDPDYLARGVDRGRIGRWTLWHCLRGSDLVTRRLAPYQQLASMLMD